MLNKLRKDNEGFTIIEVMIVLAIAGLIILIVLLAVPAVQRNSRNTALKNDAGAVVAAVSEFGTNNDGAAPNAANSNKPNNNAELTLNNGVAGTQPSVAKLQAGTQYNESTGAQTITPDAGNIYVDYSASCPATISGTSVTTVANTKSVAVVYANETTNGLQARCVDS